MYTKKIWPFVSTTLLMVGFSDPATAASLGNYTYNISRNLVDPANPARVGMVTGTLTTDTLGTLAQGNVVGWDLDLSLDGVFATLTEANSRLGLGDCGGTCTFVSTDDSLLLDVTDAVGNGGPVTGLNVFGSLTVAGGTYDGSLAIADWSLTLDSGALTEQLAFTSPAFDPLGVGSSTSVAVGDALIVGIRDSDPIRSPEPLTILGSVAAGAWIIKRKLFSSKED